MIQRDRLEEHAHRAVHRGRGQAGAEHRRGVVRARRRRDHQAGYVAQHPDRVVVVEVAAETLLVAVAGDPQHEGVAELAGREELLGSSLATYLVLSIVHVRQVLDLGHRQQAGQAAAQGDAENGLLVEQGVEHPAGPEPPLQALGHAVHATLAPDVLAEHAHAGVGLEQLAERVVDRLGQGQRGNGVVLGRRAALGPLGHLVRVTRRQRGHHLGRAGQRPAGHRLLGHVADPLADRAVAGHRLVRGEQADADQRASGRHQRVAVQVGGQGRGRAVGRLRVAAGVTEEADHGQVQERGAPPGPHQPGRLDGRVVGRDRVAAVGGQVAEAGPVAVARPPPSPAGWAR